MVEARPSPPAIPLWEEAQVGEHPGPDTEPLHRETAPVMPAARQASLEIPPSAVSRPPPSQAGGDPAAGTDPVTAARLPDAGTDVLGPALAAQAARDPRWPEVLAQARWALRIGQRRRRPDGTVEDWVDPETRAELERRGRLRLAVYDAADAFVAREGRTPNKREQRQLVARVIVEEEETQQAWDAAAAAFARNDREGARRWLRQVAAGSAHEAEEQLRADPQLADGDFPRARRRLASDNWLERPPVFDLPRAGPFETRQRAVWQASSGLNPDRLLSADQRHSTMLEIEERLEAGRAQGLTVREIADALDDPAQVARYAVALAGRGGLSLEYLALLEELLTGRSARLFLETEARRMADRVQAAMNKLPSDTWKQLQTSWPNLSSAERHAALRRVTTQVAEELGVNGATLRSFASYRHEVPASTIAFILPHTDANVRQYDLVDAPAETSNAFLGPFGTSARVPVELLTSAVAEEAVHLSQRQALADLEAGRTPASEAELIRLMLLGANAVSYYRADGANGVSDRDPFLRYLLQPSEFEAKVMHHVFVSQENDKRYKEAFGVKEDESVSTLLSRGGRSALGNYDIFE